MIYNFDMQAKIFNFKGPSFLTFAIIVALIVTLNSISVPISTRQYRCMVVYSSSNQENIKIDVRFPKFDTSSQHDEYFVIWINNTETFQAEFNRVEPGKTFRKEIELDPNVMYKVCFRINSTSGREIGPVDVQYQAYHQFRVANNNHHNIQIPPYILKQNDLKDSYNDALIMIDITERQLKLNEMHKKDEQRHFQTLDSTTTNLMWISGVQIAFICIVAIVQFFVIKKHLAGQLRL